jgi:hypothetical protein
MWWVKNVARIEMHIKFLSTNLKGRDHFGALGPDWDDNINYMLYKQGVRMWTGFSWLRTASSGGLLFYKRQGLTRLAE